MLQFIVTAAVVVVLSVRATMLCVCDAGYTTTHSLAIYRR